MARKDEIITRIQTQALEEFIKNGVQASSMEGIARAAETTKRTLYKYYPSKKDIFDEIVGKLLDQFTAYSNIIYSKEIPIEKQFKTIINKNIELMTNPDYVKTSKLLSIELIKSNPIDKAHFEKFYKAEAKFINWIKAAQEDGKIMNNQSAEIIARQVLAIIKEQVFHPALFSMHEVTEKDIKTCKEVTVSFISYFLVK